MINNPEIIEKIIDFFSENLKKIRAEFNDTQEELAKKIATSRSTVADIESGVRKMTGQFAITLLYVYGRSKLLSEYLEKQISDFEMVDAKLKVTEIELTTMYKSNTSRIDPETAVIRLVFSSLIDMLADENILFNGCNASSLNFIEGAKTENYLVVDQSVTVRIEHTKQGNLAVMIFSKGERICTFIKVKDELAMKFIEVVNKQNLCIVQLQCIKKTHNYIIRDITVI